MKVKFWIDKDKGILFLTIFSIKIVALKSRKSLTLLRKLKKNEIANCTNRLVSNNYVG
jgi:hypothetical protein